MRSLDFLIESSHLTLAAQEVGWDTAVFGFPVKSIERIKIHDSEGAYRDYKHYEEWITSERVGIVSCRLTHNDLTESMFLEAHGFRFVEMVLHPKLNSLQDFVFSEDIFRVALATVSDLDELVHIAQRSFKFDRYHIDPRLSPEYANQRYGKWVNNSYYDNTQELYKVVDGGKIVAFFIAENRKENVIHWHLTAVVPELQQQGYGYRVWMTMLNFHKLNGCRGITTTISVRNTPVLNLYSKLRFSFSIPEMTFHWLRNY